MIKVSLIGCGAWGRNVARSLQKTGSLHRIYDPNVTVSTKSQLPGIIFSTDLDDIINDPDVSAVAIATPSATHAEIALRALRAGKDVLVEKPLALRVEDAEELVVEAARLSRILMVGHVLEYHPAILKLRELISDGSLGKLYSIYSNRLNLGRIRSEENALWSFAPHDIAIFLRLIGELPQKVSCHGGAHLNHGIADSTLMHMAFSGGVDSHVFVSWLHPFKEQRLVVVGSQKMAVFNDLLDWDEKLVLYPHQVDWSEGKTPVANKAASESVVLTPKEPLLAECEHFIECVRSRCKPLTDGESGLSVLRILATAQKSLEFGGVPQGFSVKKSLPTIHPSAVVDQGAVVNEGSRVWHFSHIMGNSRVGRDCVLGQNVFVAPNVVIGNNVKIQNNVSLYEGVTLEDGVFCGPSMVFTNVINPRATIERKSEFRSTLVKAGATLGANSTIICGNTIGRNAFVGAGSVVTKSVPDYALVLGNPARVVGWMCSCGERLSSTDPQTFSCEKCSLEYVVGENGLSPRAQEQRVFPEVKREPLIETPTVQM